MTDFPFLPFALPSIGDDEIREVVEVMRSGWLTTGAKTAAFEAAFAAYVGVPHARALSSCTAALHVALVAAGIGEGDEVVVPSLTFAATANVVDQVGARPVFAEVDDLTLDVTAETLAERIGPKTRAVIPVHYAGLPCDLTALRALCDARGLLLIEDAAHAVGAMHRGDKIGSHGDLVAFSFYANKNLTTGEGGMLTTRSEDLARRIETLRLHGMSKDAWKRYSAEGSWRYDILEAGFKYNLPDLCAAIGLVQLRRLEELTARRNRLAAFYRSALADLPGLKLQAQAPEGDRHAYHLFVVRLSKKRGTPSRDEAIRALASRRIGFSVHFIPLHTMTHYRERWGTRVGDLPVTERVAEELLSLPLYPDMTDADADRVVGAVREAFHGG